LYSNIGSSFTSGKRDLVYFIPKRVGRYCSHYHKYTTVPNWVRSALN
jgi:hypothetical protein